MDNVNCSQNEKNMLDKDDIMVAKFMGYAHKCDIVTEDDMDYSEKYGIIYQYEENTVYSNIPINLVELSRDNEEFYNFFQWKNQDEGLKFVSEYEISQFKNDWNKLFEILNKIKNSVNMNFATYEITPHYFSIKIDNVLDKSNAIEKHFKILQSMSKNIIYERFINASDKPKKIIYQGILHFIKLYNNYKNDTIRKNS